MCNKTGLDLISRSALLKEGIRGKYLVGADGSIFIPVHCVRKYIKEAPAVDAVIPVLCTDCKHWLKDVPGCTDFVGRCELANYMVGATGYCVYGDRRAEEK